MYLVLFITFIVLCFVLIILGLARTEHSELSIIGFVFLFLLSVVLINNDIQIQTGVNLTNTFGEYNSSVNTSTFHITHVEEIKTYEDINLGGTLSKTMGYWLAVISFIGFMGVLLGLKPKEAM